MTYEEFCEIVRAGIARGEVKITAEIDNTIALYRYFVERENARLDVVKKETGIAGDTGGGVTE